MLNRRFLLQGLDLNSSRKVSFPRRNRRSISFPIGTRPKNCGTARNCAAGDAAQLILDNEALFQLHEAGAGLRRQAAIAKCKAWVDPIHTKSVRGKWLAKLASTPTTEVRPGQRSMPVWCTFRDAARKEHLAREAADAANTIAAEKPQAPQFQNRPLKVFGEHDHATVAQMHNCMSVGNVVAGVVCADGH